MGIIATKVSSAIIRLLVELVGCEGGFTVVSLGDLATQGIPTHCRKPMLPYQETVSPTKEDDNIDDVTSKSRVNHNMDVNAGKWSLLACT